MSESEAPDPREELLELVAATRALAEAERARGVRAVAVDSPLPAPTAPEPSADPPSLGEWAALAAPARQAAGDEVGAQGLRRIRDDLGDCQRCPLGRGRRTLVFGVGDPEADLVVVGEAPGYQEDQTGEPFVGPAGQMLDRMLLNVLGLARQQVYILNVVKCRPPNNRKPAPVEIDTCLPYLERQVLAVRPKLLLVLGSVAYRALFASDQGITRARGRWVDYRGVPALPTFHPAYLLRKPEEKRKTFDDLLALKARYDELGGRR